MGLSFKVEALSLKSRFSDTNCIIYHYIIKSGFTFHEHISIFKPCSLLLILCKELQRIFRFYLWINCITTWIVLTSWLTKVSYCDLPALSHISSVSESQATREHYISNTTPAVISDRKSFILKIHHGIQWGCVYCIIYLCMC